MEITIVLRNNDNPLDELFDMIWIRSRSHGIGQIDLAQSTLIVDVSKLKKEAIAIVLKATMNGVQRGWNLKSMVLFTNNILAVTCRVDLLPNTPKDTLSLLERLELWSQTA